VPPVARAEELPVSLGTTDQVEVFTRASTKEEVAAALRRLLPLDTIVVTPKLVRMAHQEGWLYTDLMEAPYSFVIELLADSLAVSARLGELTTLNRSTAVLAVRNNIAMMGRISRPLVRTASGNLAVKYRDLVDPDLISSGAPTEGGGAEVITLKAQETQAQPAEAKEVRWIC
jgi:hypothetical protein